MLCCHIAQFSHRDYYNFIPLESPSDRCSITHLHNLFDQGLVCADLGALQPADVLADPGDESELGSFAHGISRCDPHKAKKSTVILGKR